VYELKTDRKTCEDCETCDCLTRCQYIDLDLESARKEKLRILNGEYSRVLQECATCYACEEYCPYQNHPFFQIVELQEKLGVWPVPLPVTNQQIRMMAPRGRLGPQKLKAPVIDLCVFPMLAGCISGKLFEGTTTFSGNDVFCNIMWLHFAKNSIIRERVPQAIEVIQNHCLKESGTNELVCFHDECYATYTHLAAAFGIEVPFKPIHLFEYLVKKLTELKRDIRPIGEKIAYQRPCSNRLIPGTEPWLDEIFQLIGVERVARKYDRDNALCCAMTIRAMQKDNLADDLQSKNVEDMAAAGVKYAVFNCPVCMLSLGQLVSEKGIVPILVSDLCQKALS
jgi:Fe-S oxidoreductase